MFNEETTEKSINLAVRVGQLAAGEIKKALEKLITDISEGKYAGKEIVDAVKEPEKESEPKHGKMTLKELSKQNDGLSTMELTDPNLRLLNRELKKHNIDFAAVKDGKGKYTLFFKGKDVDSMTNAFKKYTQKIVSRANVKPSINKTLAAAKLAAQTIDAGRDKAKNRDRGALDR